MNRRIMALILLPISFGVSMMSNIPFVQGKAPVINEQKNIELSKAQDWQKLKTFWKKLNSLGSHVRKDVKNPEFSGIVNEYKNVGGYIDKLFSQKLISLKQKEILVVLIQQRYFHYERMYTMVTCYKPSYESVKMSNSQFDLEEQFKILEKIYSEKKITEEVYRTTKKKIQEDLNTLNNVSYNKDKHLSSPEAMVLVELLSK